MSLSGREGQYYHSLNTIFGAKKRWKATHNWRIFSHVPVLFPPPYEWDEILCGKYVLLGRAN